MKKTNVPAPVTADNLKSTNGRYGIRLAFKHKTNMLPGEPPQPRNQQLIRKVSGE